MLKENLKILEEEVLWLINPPTHIIVYFIANIVGLIGWLFFRVRHKVVVYGHRQIIWQKNMIVLTNHKSMIDSFMIGTVLLWPKVLYRPSLIPIHLAAKENFSNPHLFTRFLKRLCRMKGIGRAIGLFLRKSWIEKVGNFPTDVFFDTLFLLLRVLPVEPGRNDPRVIWKVKNALPKSIIHVFATAGRDIDEKYDRVARGVGYWVKQNKTHVLLVFFRGIEHIQIKGKVFPRIWPRRTIYLIIGHFIDFEDLMALSDTRDVYDEVTGRCIQAMKELGDKLSQKVNGN